MRYSYEFKLECVHQYKKDGSYPPTPEKVKQHSFRDSIRTWVKLYDLHGAKVLKRKIYERVRMGIFYLEIRLKSFGIRRELTVFSQ